jgi:hypothetical protein
MTVEAVCFSKDHKFEPSKSEEGSEVCKWCNETRATADVLSDMLLLCDLKVHPDNIAAWPQQVRDDVEIWARQHFLRASDNPVKVPPMPEVLKSYVDTGV